MLDRDAPPGHRAAKFRPLKAASAPWASKRARFRATSAWPSACSATTARSKPACSRICPGVAEAIAVTSPYKQVSREWQAPRTPSIALANGTRIGGGRSCRDGRPLRRREPRADPRRRAERVARRRRHHPARRRLQAPHLALRLPGHGRGRPEAPGRGPRALRAWPSSPRPSTHESLELVAEYADIIQIGARNMQNFALLQARAGRAGKPVLLKRGPAATIKELLLAPSTCSPRATRQVILCERGIRSFDDAHAQHCSTSRRSRSSSASPPARHRRPQPRHRRRAR